MTYPIGTRVWLRILQGASRNGEEVLWRAVVTSKPNRMGWFDTDLLLDFGPFRYVAVTKEVAAALIPGRPGDLERTRRRLEKLNDERGDQ